MPVVTWETWRIPLLAAHGLCAAGVVLSLAGMLLYPERRAGRVAMSLLWLLLLGSAVTGGMLYPTFETRVLWEKLGYTHGWGERLFRAKTHLAVMAIAPALLLPRLRRLALSDQVSPRMVRVAQTFIAALIALALTLCILAEGLIRHGGWGA